MLKPCMNGATYFMLTSLTGNPMFGTPQKLKQFADWSSVASNCLDRPSQNTCLCSRFMRGEELTALKRDSRAVAY